MSLPPGFTAIKDTKESKTAVSLIGVIVACQEPRKSKGTDWVCDITIQDDFTSDDATITSTIGCRIFRPRPELFPKISGLGDVAIIRNFRIDTWGLQTSCVYAVALRSGVLVFPAAQIPKPNLSQAYLQGSQQLPHSAISGTKEPSPLEQHAVILLKSSAPDLVQQVQQQHGPTFSVTPAKRDRLSLIKDLNFDSYHDIRAQVVNIYRNNFGNVEMKVTDYTSNDALYLYPELDDPMNWNPDKTFTGPYGQLTLSVILYGNNAVFTTDHLARGDYVFLRNVHTKISPAGKLEGALHEDRQYPNHIDVKRLLNDSDIDEIKAREEAYEQKRAKKDAFEELDNGPKKPSAKASAKKKAEKRARLKLQKQEEQKDIAEKAERWEAQKTGVNLNSKTRAASSAINTNDSSTGGLSRDTDVDYIGHHLQCPSEGTHTYTIQRFHTSVRQL